MLAYIISVNQRKRNTGFKRLVEMEEAPHGYGELEKYQAEHPDEKQPVEKESVHSKLKSYQAEAKTTARKDKEKQKKKETER